MSVANGAQTLSSSTSTQIVPADSSRTIVWLYNNDPEAIVYLNVGGSAIIGYGVRLNPKGGSWSTTNIAAIEGVASYGAPVVTWSSA